MSHAVVFPVRRYECDAYGHLNNVTYARWIGEAAADARRAAGIAAGEGWQTRRLDIEYLRPVRYGDTAVVVATVCAAGPEWVRTALEVRVEGRAEPAARAQLDAGQEQAAAAGDAAGEIPALAPLPELPPAPPGAFRMRRRVGWQDLDMAQRVSDARLLDFVESCGMGVIEAHGWPAERMAAAGFAILLAGHRLQRIAAPALNDELEVATWASAVRRASATRHYTIARAEDGALLARVDTLGVWVDLASGRPIRIPQQFLDDFAANIAG